MSLRVLGPLEVVLPAGRVALGGPQQRLLLGLLAAWRGRTVSVDELIDGLWPDSSQARPRKTLQVYITRLRAQLGPYASAIQSDGGGYRLDAGVLPVDADEFERATAAGGQQDASTLRHALALWRGHAFADLVGCPAIFPSAVYLDERRAAAQLALYEFDIAADPVGALGALELAVAEHPLHESFTALLMRAQYAAGRQVDALRTYGALRRRLADELGLEPGPDLRDLERQILRHAVVVTPPAGSAVERERRRVTLVSVATQPAGAEPGTTPPDPEAELAASTAVQRSIRSLVVQAGGVILNDAANELTACFGFPSEERSVEQAVRAAVAIGDLGPTHPSLTIRVGIDTGVVIVESEGAAATLTGIHGHLLRAARALRDGARPNEVIVGTTTAHALGPVAHLQPRDRSFAFAGWAPQPAEDGLADDATGLLGRESTLAELRVIAADATARLQVVSVSGPAGVGKTAVIDRFLAMVDDRWATIRVGCSGRDASTPLHPFRTEFRELFTGREPTIGAVVAAIRERSGSRRPLLVVEDAHEADRSTLELLAALYRRVPSGLVVLTRRPSGDDKLVLDDEPVLDIELAPLDRATARALAQRTSGEHRLPLQVLNSIADRSGGIPLYVQALTSAAIEGGEGDELPATLYDSLMSVLDRVGPARRLAQLGAVIGSTFRTEDLASIAGDTYDEPTRRAHLNALVDAGIIEAAGADQYRFAHQLVADAAYESLLNADRQRLHSQIAETWPAAEPHRLAFHLEEAGRAFEAAVAWCRASTIALRRASDAEGLLLARRARRLLNQLDPTADRDEGETRRRVLHNLAVALQATTHGSDELTEVIAAGRAMARDRDLTLDIIDISNRHAIGDVPGATAVAREALAAAQRAGNEENAPVAMVFLGASLLWEGNVAEALELLDGAARFWSTAPPGGNLRGRTLGAMHAQLGLARFLLDRPEDARRSLTTARAVVEDDPYGECLSTSMTAVVAQLAGRPDEVRAAIEPVWAMAVELASDFWLTWAEALLGWAVAGEDDGAAGLAMMTEAVDHPASRQTIPYFCALLGERLRLSGDPTAALHRLDQGLATAEETGEQVWTPLLLLERAKCLRALSRDDEAEATLGAAEHRAAMMGELMLVRRCRDWRATDEAGRHA